MLTTERVHGGRLGSSSAHRLSVHTKRQWVSMEPYPKRATSATDCRWSEKISPQNANTRRENEKSICLQRKKDIWVWDTKHNCTRSTGKEGGAGN